MNKTSCPYILLIMNCRVYSYKAQLQRDTWLKTIPSNIHYYHVIGDPKLDTEYSFNEDDRVLSVRTEDDYNSLPKKVISAYSAIHETFNYNYIFKTDDDQDLINPRFFEMITNIVSRKQSIDQIHYAGNIVHVKTPYLSKYHTIHPELPPNLKIYPTDYCSGRFYLLSALAVEDLLQKRAQIEEEYLEDYAIGFHLKEELKQNSGLLHIHTSNFFQDV